MREGIMEREGKGRKAGKLVGRESLVANWRRKILHDAMLPILLFCMYILDAI